MEINKREAEFRKWVKAQLSPHFFMQTIETSTSTGVPDLFLAREGRYAWVELKCDVIDKPPLIRKEQRVWGIRHAQKKGQTLLIQRSDYDLSIRIWVQPISNVAPSGKFLKVLDPPTIVLPHGRGEFIEVMKNLI